MAIAAVCATLTASCAVGAEGKTVAERLRAGEPVSAAWVLNNNINAEIIAEAGFDVVVPDMEHAPVTIPQLINILQAIKGTNCFPLVRAPANDLTILKQILDVGAQGVHVPFVNTKEEAEYAVRACKYPPEGIRGIASSQRATTFAIRKDEYFARANKDIIVIVAIESPTAVANLEEIVKVPGIDGIFIAPSDLSTSMGYFYNPAAPEVQKTIRYIEDVAKKAGKFVGTIASDFNAAKALYDRGYALVYYMSDNGVVSSAARAAVKQFKDVYGNK